MKKNLYKIFSDIFDIYPEEKFILQFIQDNSTINIESIYKNSLLKINIIFISIWNYLYKTYPTRKDFIDFLHKNNISLDYIICNDKYFFNLILQYFSLHLNIGIINIYSQDDIYKKYIESFNVNIQDKIQNKLYYRYNIIQNTIQENNILFFIKTIYSNYIKTNEDIELDLNENIYFNEKDNEYMNDIEKIQYSLYQNNSFILKCIQSITIIIDAEYFKYFKENQIRNIIKIYTETYNTHVLLINCEQKITWYDSCYSYHMSHNIIKILPILSKHHMTISQFIYPRVKSLSYNRQMSNYYLLANKYSIKDYELLIGYDKYLIRSEKLYEIETLLEKYPLYYKVLLNEPNIIIHQDGFMHILKYYIQKSCPILNPNPMNNILLFIKFIYQYYSKHIESLSIKQKNDKSKYCIVLIDNRPNILSVLSLLITYKNINDNWDIKIYTSKNALDFYNKYFKDIAEIIHLEDLDVEKFHIDIYNKILKSEELWFNLIDYERILICQDDGIIIRNGIDNFLKYDYIGAQWLDCSVNTYLKENVNSELVGNGGLSIRNPKKMLEIVQTFIKQKNILFNNNIQYIPEDVYFSKYIKKIENTILPTGQDANMFSSEEILYEKSIGFHKFWTYHNPDLIKKYFNLLIS